MAQEGQSPVKTREQVGRRGFAVLLASLAIICVCLGASAARFFGLWPVAPSAVELTAEPTPGETVPTATATPEIAGGEGVVGEPVLAEQAGGLDVGATVSPDATATPTPLPAIPGCEALLQAREARSAGEWGAYAEGMLDLWVTGWATTVTEVGGFSRDLGGYPVQLAVIEDCYVVYTEEDEDEAGGLVKNQTLRVTGKIARVSSAVGPITLHLAPDSVVLMPGETPEPEVAPTLLDMTYSEVYERYAEMTDLQREAFREDIVGLRVVWEAPVDSIGANDRILLEGSDATDLLWVYLDGAPAEVLSGLEAGDILAFEARIASTDQGPAGAGFAVFLDYLSDAE